MFDIKKILGESADALSPEVLTALGTIFQQRLTESTATQLQEAEAKHVSEIKTLTEGFNAQLQEQEETLKATMVAKIDGFLSESVIQWANQNAPAIDSRLKTEAAENILVNLRNVLAESGIAVDTDGRQLAEEANQRVIELETQLNETQSEVAALREVAATQARLRLVTEACEGLAQTQVEKVIQLTEGFDVSDEEIFKNRAVMFRKLVEGEGEGKGKEGDGKGKDPKDPDDKGGEGKGKEKDKKNETSSELNESVAAQINAMRQMNG